jgi:hypothetical protein
MTSNAPEDEPKNGKPPGWILSRIHRHLFWILIVALGAWLVVSIIIVLGIERGWL